MEDGYQDYSVTVTYNGSEIDEFEVRGSSHEDAYEKAAKQVEESVGFQLNAI